MRIHIPFTGFSIGVRLSSKMQDAGAPGAVSQLLAVNLRIIDRRPYLAVHVLWLCIGAGWL